MWRLFSKAVYVAQSHHFLRIRSHLQKNDGAVRCLTVYSRSLLAAHNEETNMTKYSVEEEWRIVDNQRAFPPQFNSRKESHCLEESKQDRLLKFWKTIFQQWRTNGASRKHSTHLFWTELLIKTDTHLILDETGWISLISFRVQDKCLLCVSTVCCFVLLPVTYFWKPINTTTTESSQKKNTSCITMTAV